MAYNQSKIKSFRRCQKQYSFRYDYGEPGPDGEKRELVPKYPSLPLKIGGWLHILQQSFHLKWAGDASADWTLDHDRLTHQFEGMFDEEKDRYGDLPTNSWRLMTSYIRHVEKDMDRFTVAKLKNGEPAVEFLLDVPLSGLGFGTRFKGRVDLMVEDHELGGLWIWDAKWVRSVPGPDERTMSPQRLMYVWGARKMNYKVRGFAHCYMRKKVPTEPNVLKRSGQYGTAGMLTTKHSLDSDIPTYLAAIKRQHGGQAKMLAQTYYADKLKELKARESTWFRRELNPTSQVELRQALGEFLTTCIHIENRSTGQFVPRTYTFGCQRYCDYHDPCIGEFTGADIKPLLKARYESVNERYSEEEDDE